MNYWCKRIEADPERHKEIEAEVIKFLAEIDDKITALKAKFGDAV